MNNDKVVTFPKKPRRYTKREKVAAVIAAEMSSGKAAAEAHGIPRATLHGWMSDPELEHLRHKTREDFLEEITVLQHLAAEQIRLKITQFEPRDLSILFGILSDKKQLLSGGATSRPDITITEKMADHERDALRDAIDDWLKKDVVPV